MTEKEKAKELVDEFYEYSGDESTFDDVLAVLRICEKERRERAIQCALTCVDEIIENEKKYYGNREMKYWQEVKQEIELLKE